MLLEETVEDVETVAERAGDDDGVKAGKLVGDEVEEVIPLPATKYRGLDPALRVRTGTTNRSPSAEARCG